MTFEEAVISGLMSAGGIAIAYLIIGLIIR